MRFSIDNLSINEDDNRAWRGSFAKHRVEGREWLYTVVDEGQERYRQWQFAVRVPADISEPIQVQPTKTPRRTSYRALLRRSLTFKRGTMPGYRARAYCPAAFADPSGERTKTTARRGERDSMPYWLKPLRRSMRLKPTVRRTRGTDARTQVLVVDPRDHQRMIQAYFALKCWPSLRHEGLRRPPA